LCGYSVNTDPNNTTIARLKKLAEKMGLDLSKLPKPTEYPPFTIELHHEHRPTHYLICKDQQEFDDWANQFRTCCWRTEGLTLDKEAHKIAFPIALRKTRWEMGRWGWYWNEGSEEQQLTDAIADELDWDIMGRVYSKLFGPWFIRNTLRNQSLKVIGAMVSAAVKPAWAGLAKVVEELHPKMEPKVRELCEPIFEAEAKILEAMKNAVMSVLDPLLQEHVAPHLAKILSYIKQPVIDGYQASVKVWTEQIDAWKPEAELKKSFSELNWYTWRYWPLQPAYEQTQKMYETLDELSIIFKHIWPWYIIWRANEDINKRSDNAVWTWEHQLLDAQEAKTEVDKAFGEKVKANVLPRLQHDCELASLRFMCKVIRRCIMPPLDAVVHPAAKVIIDPLAESIPEPLREFIDIKEMFETLYNSIVDASIFTIVGYDPKKGASSRSS